MIVSGMRLTMMWCASSSYGYRIHYIESIMKALRSTQPNPFYLQEEMGLSDAEVKERVRKVASKVRKVTQSMVICDTENRDKLKRRCKEQQVQLDALCKEFMTVGIMVEGNVPALASLVDQNKYLHGKLIELEMEKEKHMVQVRFVLQLPCIHIDLND